MTQFDKLIARIRNNPRGVQFEDACRVAEKLGFQRRGGSGSLTVYVRPGEPRALNFQRMQDGKLKPYQARQLITMIEAYRDHFDADHARDDEDDRP